MKKIISIILVAVLLLSLTACGKSKAETEHEKFHNAMNEFVNSLD